MIKNIRKIVVTDKDGVEHTFEGIEGYAQVYTKSKIGQPYQQAVTFELLLPPRPEVKA